jgi:hypothetical protein
MRGILKRNRSSKIYADGRTYDGKLHTFKECDYLAIWSSLDVQVKEIDPKLCIQNIPDPGSRAYKLRMMQLAAEHRSQGWEEGKSEHDDTLNSANIEHIKDELINDELDIVAL